MSILLPIGRAALAVLAALAVHACAGPGPQTFEPVPLAADPTPPEPTWRYACDELSFAAQLEGGAIRLFLPEGTLLLPQRPAASGARYSDGAVTFWSHGDEALLETPSRSLADCRGQAVADPWQAARLRGVHFRAIGQEPGWVLEIEGERMVLLADYGTRRVAVPAARPELEPRAGPTTYRTRTEAHDLAVVILDRPCRDIMSGEAFPASVTVRLDGEELSGCGRPL